MRVSVTKYLFQLAWTIAAVLLTWRGLLWEVEYFKSPGPQYYRLCLILLAASPFALAAYQWIRRRGAWRYELAALAGLPVVAGLIYATRATAVTLWIFVACFACGRFLLRRLDLRTAGAPEEIALSAGAGFGMLFCALFVLGMLSLYYAWTFVLLLVLPTGLLWRDVAALGAALVRCHREWARNQGFSSPLGAVLVVFAALFAACSLMVVLAPSVTFDVLKFHLPSVQYYAAIHAVRPVPNVFYSFNPQGVESLMTLGLVLAGQPAAQMLHPIFYLLTMLLAFHIAREWGAGRLAAFAGVVCAIAVPVFHWAGSVAKNDLALAFFVVAALDCCLRWRATGSFRWIQLGVFFLAMAGAAKTLAVLAIPGAALLFAWAAWRQPRRIRALASLLAIYLCFAFPWQIRTFFFTGNPLYPVTGTFASGVAHGVELRTIALRYLRMPWDLIFNGGDYMDHMLRIPLGVTLVFFAPLWLLVRKPFDRAAAVCLLYSGAYLLIWSWSPSLMQVRYAAAPFLLLFLFTGCRVADFHEASPAWVRWPLLATLAYCLVFALCGSTINEINGPQLRLFARRIDDREYLREALAPYRALEFLRTRWKPGGWLLGVGTCSFAYAPEPLQFNCIVTDRYDPDEIRRELRQQRYDFLILPAGALEPAVMGPQATPLYHDGNFAVYRLP